jgi:hypothetical protein
LAFRAQEERMGSTDRQDHLGQPALRVREVKSGRQGPRANQALRVLEDRPASADRLDHLG